MEPIDISSDSELEIDFEGFDGSQENFFSNTRTLPDWAASSSAGYGTQNLSFDDIGVHDISEMDVNPMVWNSNQPCFGENMSAVDSKGVDMNGSQRYQSREYLASSHGGTSNISGTDYESFLPQPSKRNLPATVHYTSYDSKSNISNGGRNIQINTSQRPMQCSTGLSASHQYGLNEDDLFIYESSGSRILPQSFTNRNPLPLSSSLSSDTQLRSDERAAGNNERLIFRAALQDLFQPNTECDVQPGLLSVSLLKHQRIALQWMLHKETRSLHCFGGILADDQGLGKTISMISLIMAQKYAEINSKSEQNNFQKAEPLNLDEDDSITTIADNNPRIGESKDASSTTSFNGRRPPAGTLVVCPASVLRQWARELDEKVAIGSKLRVLVYHGASRTKDHVELATYDVVLTTYAIVTNEVPKRNLAEGEDAEGLGSGFPNIKKQKNKNGTKKRKKGKNGLDCPDIDNISGALAKVVWSRVVLDEAQTIKNYRTQVARACCSLRAKKRWCLSGTPIQNTIDDLYSYFKFLRYEPYNVYKQFHSQIKVPIYKNSLNGYKKLQVVLKSVLLRRTKETLLNGEPIISLPPKTIFLKKAEFSIEERDFYTWLETESRSKFKAFAAAGTVKQNYANILLMLLRLRQACDHPMLVKGSISGSAGRLSQDLVKSLPSNLVANLLSRLAVSSAICVVCNDPPEESVVTLCGHVFCYQCVSDYLIGDENTCPAPGCKEHLGPDNVFSEETLKTSGASEQSSADSRRQFDEGSAVCQRDYVSSKVNAILDTLQSARNSDDDTAKGSVKSIIFSQWTGMLDLVEHSLKKHVINFRRLDGTMSLVSRDKAVKDFNTDPEVAVMLMSLKAGNLGLNMVAASHVILLDLWWNPTTEDQAIDRAHRIGQTRAVTVTRLTVKNTVEDRILALQEEKRKMVAAAFGEDQGGTSASRLTVEDLKYLFNVDF